MGINNRANRAKKKAARARTERLRAAASAAGWPNMDSWMSDEDSVPDPPDPSLFDTTGCPVVASCAGCGTTTGELGAVTSALSGPGGYRVACATLCASCDGRSFLHLLGPAGLEHATAAHATHRADS